MYKLTATKSCNILSDQKDLKNLIEKLEICCTNLQKLLEQQKSPAPVQNTTRQLFKNILTVGELLERQDTTYH